jgi:uncharacterized SAM-binding protein YcdF (DUF218 family)
MPLGVVMFLLVLALVILRYGRKRFAASVLTLAVAVLWVASLPVVADSLYRGLESDHPPKKLSEVPRGGCVIVLGGAVGAPVPPRVDIELHEEVDRVYKTAELYLAGKAPLVVVTGGNQPWSSSKTAEADLIRDLLVKWGVPSDKNFLEGSSRNTRENALYTKNLLDAINCQSPLLVTSAAHMPRALAAFSSAGIRATPVATGIRVVGQRLPVLMDFLPSAQALAMTSDAIREWVGRKVYSWQGWN